MDYILLKFLLLKYCFVVPLTVSLCILNYLSFVILWTVHCPNFLLDCYSATDLTMMFQLLILFNCFATYILHPGSCHYFPSFLPTVVLTRVRARANYH
jgi:flagellar biosynthesis component FlhA